MSYTSGIGSTQQLLAAVSTTTAASRAQLDETTGAGATAATSPSDSDDLTTFSTVGSLMGQPADDSDLNTDKIAALQQAIASGTYNVSASDVADKLIATLSSQVQGN